MREDIALMPNGKTTIYGLVECGQHADALPALDEVYQLVVDSEICDGMTVIAVFHADRLRAGG